MNSDYVRMALALTKDGHLTHGIVPMATSKWSRDNPLIRQTLSSSNSGCLQYTYFYCVVRGLNERLRAQWQGKCMQVRSE